ncbi:hypothetical protein [Nocardia asteroides]|uniref:hypothetical protein n=1 Tax=Nocardia asteroides TaxID=1824 RepID=UPI001E5DE1C3|nr:hypothetical protein [Nocardia asteroides]UGT63350.1 hypothetical protein LTT61_08585 [Nocardia asteroides]
MAPPKAPEPKIDAKVDTKGDTTGNGVDVGGAILSGSPIKSQDGKYQLMLDNGNLVLTGPNGVVWESATTNTNPSTDRGSGNILAASIGPDGQIILKADAYYQSLPVWATDKVPGAVRLQLNNDGSLVFLDKDNKPIGTVAGPDPDRGLDWHLHHPYGASANLDKHIDICENFLITSCARELWGNGKETANPSLDQLLTDAGLQGTWIDSTMTDRYQGKTDRLDKVNADLYQKVQQVHVTTSDLSAKSAAALKAIEARVDSTNEKLFAPRRAYQVPEVVMDTPMEIKYDEKGNVVGDPKLPPATEDFLLGVLHDMVHFVESEIKKVSDAADAGGGDVKDKEPKYDGENNGGGRNNNGGGQYTDTSAGPPGTQDFSGLYGDLLGTDTALGADPLAAGGSGSNKIVDMLNSAIKEIEGGAGTTAGGPGGTVAGGGGSTGGGSTGSAGSGMNQMMQSLPMMMMMQQMMQSMSQGRDRDRDRDREDQDEREDEREPEPGQDPNVPVQQVQNPVTAPPPGTVTADPAAPPPVVLGNKSMVDVQLPTKPPSTQQVSQVVAEAIQRELNNPNGSDARAAYVGTPGESSAANPWTVVDGNDVRTGDVAQWRDHTGLVVVVDGVPNIVVDGQIIPLDPNNPADGEFLGFARPGGAGIGEQAVPGAEEAPPIPATPSTPPVPMPPAVTAPPPVSVTI